MPKLKAGDPVSYYHPKILEDMLDDEGERIAPEGTLRSFNAKIVEVHAVDELGEPTFCTLRVALPSGNATLKMVPCWALKGDGSKPCWGTYVEPKKATAEATAPVENDALARALGMPKAIVKQVTEPAAHGEVVVEARGVVPEE